MAFGKFFEIIIGAAAFVLIAIFFVIYNALIEVRNNVNRAWADIDVLLEKRHDLIGKMVDTVKGYETYEKSVLLQITKMRSSWTAAQGADSKTKMETSNQISTALKSVFAVSENYPDIKANTVFLELQTALEDIENQIADRREFYNDSVNQYNIRIQTLPYGLFAGPLGYKQMPFFKAPSDELNPTNLKV